MNDNTVALDLSIPAPSYPAEVLVTPDTQPQATVVELWKHLHGRYPDRFFGSGGRLVEIKDGARFTIESDRLLALLDQAAVIVRSDGEKVWKGRPTRDDRAAMIHAPDAPRVDWIRSCPYMAADGRVVTSPGYDAASALYLAWSPQAAPVDPDTVTDEDVRACVEKLLGGFAFDNHPSYYAHALGLLLLVVMRPAIDDPTPFHAVTALEEGSGKSLLAQIPGYLLLGRAPKMLVFSDGGGRTYDIAAELRDEPDFLFFDNLPTGEMLADPHLHGALTSRVYGARIVRTSGTFNVQINAIWAATANLLDFDAEQARRSVKIGLVKETRAGRDLNLMAWVRDNRSHVLSCLLRLAVSWHAAGRPGPDGDRTLPSYPVWSATIGGAVDHAARVFGLGEVGAFLHPDTRPISRDIRQWRALYANWPNAGDEAGSKARLTATDVCEVATRLDLDVIAKPGASGKGGAMSIGRKLKTMCSSRRVIDGWRLTASTINGVTCYQPVGAP